MKIHRIFFPALLRPIFRVFFCVLFLPAIGAMAGDSLSAPKAGEVYEITRSTKTSYKSAGSSGSSQGRNKLIERVTGLRPDGLELEYDLPETATDRERKRSWQFPARIFKPFDGPPRLLNGPELEARVENWLKTFKVPRAACGRTVFTWAAFRIECDPQSVIKTIQSFDMGAVKLHEGASYRDATALVPGNLAKKAAGSDAVTFTAELPVDPDAVRRARAEADVTIAEMSNKPLTLEAALEKRKQDAVSGTISVVFEADAAGNVHRRTKTTKVDIKGPGGETETRTTTETLERKLISSSTVADTDGEK